MHYTHLGVTAIVVGRCRSSYGGAAPRGGCVAAATRSARGRAQRRPSQLPCRPGRSSFTAHRRAGMEPDACGARSGPSVRLMSTASASARTLREHHVRPEMCVMHRVETEGVFEWPFAVLCRPDRLVGPMRVAYAKVHTPKNGGNEVFTRLKKAWEAAWLGPVLARVARRPSRTTSPATSRSPAAAPTTRASRGTSS